MAAERATPPLLSSHSLPLFFLFSFLYYVPSAILDLKSLEISKQCLRRPFTFLGFHLPESSFLCPAEVVCLQCLVRKSILSFGLREVLHSLPYKRSLIVCVFFNLPVFRLVITVCIRWCLTEMTFTCHCLVKTIWYPR